MCSLLICNITVPHTVIILIGPTYSTSMYSGVAHYKFSQTSFSLLKKERKKAKDSAYQDHHQASFLFADNENRSIRAQQPACRVKQ